MRIFLLEIFQAFSRRYNAWSILALNQKDHREVDCMVAFMGLGGLRVRHAGEE